MKSLMMLSDSSSRAKKKALHANNTEYDPTFKTPDQEGSKRF